MLDLSAGPELADNPYAARLFELHDSDGDGMLSWSEFLTAIDAMTKLGKDDERTECEPCAPLSYRPQGGTLIGQQTLGIHRPGIDLVV